MKTTETSRLKLRLELIWWLFTILVAVAVLSPIFLNGVKYPFYLENVLFIVLFVTVTRYIFFLKHTWLARNNWVKAGLIVTSGIAIFVCATGLTDFNNYVEEVGLQELVKDLSAKQQYSIIRYIQKEVIFFGVGSVISLIVLPVRMLISIWRVRNTLTKT